MLLVCDCSKEAHEHLFSLPYNYVELHHKHGVEKDANLAYDSGNNEPKRGFGHIAFLTPDVPAAVAKLYEHGSKFKKRPGEQTDVIVSGLLNVRTRSMTRDEFESF